MISITLIEDKFCIYHRSHKFTFSLFCWQIQDGMYTGLVKLQGNLSDVNLQDIYSRSKVGTWLQIYVAIFNPGCPSTQPNCRNWRREMGRATTKSFFLTTKSSFLNIKLVDGSKFWSIDCRIANCQPSLSMNSQLVTWLIDKFRSKMMSEVGPVGCPYKQLKTQKILVAISATWISRTWTNP